MSEKIVVIGLGYVGLPLLIALSRHFEGVIGFDIDRHRIDALKNGEDWTGECDRETLMTTKATLTDRALDLEPCSIFIATVPTPIDHAKRPDLRPVMGACRTIGEILRQRKSKRSDRDFIPPLIIFESTVYPGLTEEICGKAIAQISGLEQHKDFKLGYSPERINPGDKKNRLETITKIVSAEDDASLARMTAVYGAVIEAGLHQAPSIAVAEAAKVLENTQRDLNIALMNELAIICDKMNIRTQDVLKAAGTKWNFLKFTPGLVGGHCIGVDPYYLTSRAEELGYNPQVISAGRRINDNMSIFIAQKIVKLMVSGGTRDPHPRVGVLGLTFKEDVRDFRNSRVPEIVAELETFGVQVMVHDPMVDPAHVQREYALDLVPRAELKNLDALVLAVPHQVFLKDITELLATVKPSGWVIDVKSAIDPNVLLAGLRYWSL